MSSTVKTAPVKSAPATKDTGRVKVGSGMMRFATTSKSTADAGRVQVGSGMKRF